MKNVKKKRRHHNSITITVNHNKRGASKYKCETSYSNNPSYKKAKTGIRDCFINHTSHSEKLKNENRRLIVNVLLMMVAQKHVNSDIAAELNHKGTLERINIGFLNG